MSFSSDVKKELAAISDGERSCCAHAFAYGFLLLGRSFGASGIGIQTEYDFIAEHYIKCIEQAVSAVSVATEYSPGGKYTVTVPGADDRLGLLACFGHAEPQPSLRLNYANFSGDCCFGPFLRGAFLAAGTVTAPSKNYHLELSMPYYHLSRDIQKFMINLDLGAKLSRRQGYNIIYFKDSESIEDALTLMGATRSALEMMGIKIYKDFRNRANRVTNCETANIGKAVQASARQIDAINLIDSQKSLSFLPPQLRELAVKRRDNPEISMRELGELLEPPLSRSGVNHRLTQIKSIAAQIRDQTTPPCGHPSTEGE